MEAKGPSAFMAGYQAVGDWLGKHQDRDYLLASEPDDDADDKVQA
jgi:tyrosine-protein kinase Etk/Wzc